MKHESLLRAGGAEPAHLQREPIELMVVVATRKPADGKRLGISSTGFYSNSPACARRCR